MATAMGIQTQPQPALMADGPIVNDFAIVAATVNGTGSATANTALIRALFHMGIPINGKNLFPSNIAGLPTWYTIRLSQDGYIARREGTEILIAFNEKTAAQDLAALPPGGVCFYSDDLRGFTRSRDDVVYYPMPVKEMVKQSGATAKLRDYVATMVYVGVVSQMLGIELDEIRAALEYHFQGKAKAVELNWGVVSNSAQWARDNLTKLDRFHVERMDKTRGQILIDGNTASALGAIYGGVGVVAWYPITPATSLADALNEYLPRLRADGDTTTYAIIQAEDELAAIGIVMGAGWAGARAMTSTSGPGISLMSEFAGFGYFAEVPGVIVDVMRMGPSTGLPTRVSQGDVMAAYFLGHGDTRHVCLLPGSVAECFEFGYRAFDLAEHLQTPVFVLTDLDLGMNLWMSEPFAYPPQPLDRGKVLDAEAVARLEATWGRYKDVDGDGIGYRTLPGTEHPLAAYFTRGTGHNEMALYSERPDDWKNNLDRLTRKHETARTLVPAPILTDDADAEVGIIAYGSADSAIVEARDRLAREGVTTSYLRLRALPLTEQVREFAARFARVYVIELNHEGQMAQILRLEYPELAARFVPIAHCDGLPLTARLVTQAVLDHERQPRLAQER